MANQLYPKGKEALLGADADLDAATIKVCLTNTAFNSAHQFLSDITADYTSPALTAVTITNGVFDTSNPVFTAVPAGPAEAYAVCFIDTGVAATSRLLFHIDTAAGLPVTPDGTDVTIEVNASGWFTL